MPHVVEIDPKRCKSCGICVAFCPKEVLTLLPGDKAKVTAPENCVGCGMCELRCPDFAIEVKKNG